MNPIVACLIGLAVGYALRMPRPIRRPISLRIEPNVVIPTPRERIAAGQVWRNAWPDYTDPDNAGA